MVVCACFCQKCKLCLILAGILAIFVIAGLTLRKGVLAENGFKLIKKIRSLKKTPYKGTCIAQNLNIKCHELGIISQRFFKVIFTKKETVLTI